MQMENHIYTVSHLPFFYDLEQIYEKTRVKPNLFTRASKV